jgi:hypothetical protein
MPNEFANISGYDGWKSKLDQLLAVAKTASESGTPAARRKIAERLTDFAMESSPDTAEIVELDAIALEASRTILLNNIAGEVDAIAARTATLVTLAKKLGAVGRAVAETAASIRLERAHRVVDAMTEVVRAADDLDSVLSDDDEVLRRKIKRIAGALVALRAEIENGPGRRDA